MIKFLIYGLAIVPSFFFSYLFYSYETEEYLQNYTKDYLDVSTRRFHHINDRFKQLVKYQDILTILLESKKSLDNKDIDAFIEKSGVHNICFSKNYKIFKHRSNSLCHYASPFEEIRAFQEKSVDFLILNKWTNHGYFSMITKLDHIYPSDQIGNITEQILFSNNMTSELTTKNISNSKNPVLRTDFKEIIKKQGFHLLYVSRLHPSLNYQKSLQNIKLIAVLIFIILSVTLIIFIRIKRQLKFSNIALNLSDIKINRLENLNKLALETSGIMLWEWERENPKYIKASKQLIKLLGIPSVSNNHVHIKDILRITDLDFSVIKRIWYNSFQDHKDENFPINILKTDEPKFGYCFLKVYITNRSNRATRIIGTFQDITHLRRREMELKKSNESLNQFAYIASHDLREPLRGIRSFSQFLQEDYQDKLDKDANSYINTIIKLSTRLESYLDSLLFYSRFDRLEMSYKDTRVCDIIADIRINFLPAQEKTINIKYEGIDELLYLDSDKVHRIFLNLIQNSIRYNDKDVVLINISSKKISENKILFSVKDNGIGIKKEHWTRIFKIFKRLHGKDKYDSGTGLGLAIVEKAVIQHGGEIYVKDSTFGESTTFNFTLTEKKRLNE